jgi:molybdopterin/thiamine biosynthesis adenylyltransferase
MNNKISFLLQQESRERLRPDGSPFLALDLTDAMVISKNTGTPLYEVEKLALGLGITPTRFSRNQRVLSVTDQYKLHMAHVAIIGLGGLGGGVTEFLARIGVGNFTLVDGDVFDESNLNRQLLSSVANIGVAKATVAGKRVAEINPAARVHTITTFLAEENGYEILKNVDIAIDCLDTIPARFILERSCAKRNIPMVSAAIAGTSGQATSIVPSSPGLSALYGKENDAPKRGVEAGLGTLVFTASHMASIECAETVNIILGRKSSLTHTLLFSDLSDYSVERIQLS